MSRSAFERIPLSPRRAAGLHGPRARPDARLDRGRPRQGDGLTVKRLEGALLRAEERLKAKLDSAKDPGITFEATGIDYLCIDEAHGYKNLRTPSNITDAAIDGSMRASDLDMKIDYLRRRNGRRVVTFATATPIANSVTEAYVMQRYLRPDLLEAAGIEVFDTWAATFGQVVTQVELAPEGGSSFRMKSRFARFRNVPEMLRMFHVAADVKTADDLALPVPALARRPTTASGARRPSPSSRPTNCSPTSPTSATAPSQVRNRAVGPDEDNMLKISGDGRRAALDLRLVGLPQDTPGKIARRRRPDRRDLARPPRRRVPRPRRHPVPGPRVAAAGVLRPGHPRATAGTSTTSSATSSPPAGCPATPVRFIHDAKTDRDKAQLFAACRSGHVAVLVGSTEKMGVGTNVQDRAIALHHLDAPWRPADVAQREGRILRQGNLNPEVQIIRYVTGRSFDGYMWQTLERKARFIHQVMHGRLDTREITDIGDTALSFSEVKALATGNPLLMDKAEADAALARLQRAERAHHRNQDALRHAITELRRPTSPGSPRSPPPSTPRSPGGRTPAASKFTMTVGEHQHSKRADADRHLTDLVRRPDSPSSTASARSSSGRRARRLPAHRQRPPHPGTVTVTLSLDERPAPASRSPPAISPTPTRPRWSPGWRTASATSKNAAPRPSPTSTTPAARSTTPPPASASPSPRPSNSPPPATESGKSTPNWSGSPQLLRPTPVRTAPSRRAGRIPARRGRATARWQMRLSWRRASRRLIHPALGGASRGK